MSSIKAKNRTEEAVMKFSDDTVLWLKDKTGKEADPWQAVAIKRLSGENWPGTTTPVMDGGFAYGETTERLDRSLEEVIVENLSVLPTSASETAHHARPRLHHSCCPSREMRPLPPFLSAKSGDRSAAGTPKA